MRKPQFTTTHNDTELIVQCANCGEVNLHAFRVQVFERREEDAEDGRVVDVSYGEPINTRDDAEHGNPSGRRNGIRIYFQCEQCPHISVLALYQHKGTEYLTWLT
jgi:hypothetical protein